MSTANVEITKRLNDSFATGGIEASLAWFEFVGLRE